MRLVTVSVFGISAVSRASYTMWRGRTFESRPVVFFPSLVVPNSVVRSEPEYVVGMAMNGSGRDATSALPSPIAEPPPRVTITSAPLVSSARRASASPSSGT